MQIINDLVQVSAAAPRLSSSAVMQKNAESSVTGWLNYFKIFGHVHQSKFAQ